MGEKPNILQRISTLFSGPLEGIDSLRALDITKHSQVTVGIEDWDEMQLACGAIDIATSELRKSSHRSELLPSVAAERVKNARINAFRIIERWGMEVLVEVSNSTDEKGCEVVARGGGKYFLQRNLVEKDLPDGDKETVGVELVVRRKLVEPKGRVRQPV